jgi:hypothetical protein
MTDLPSHKRLLALLRMTESGADNEALTALRMANALLKKEGWDWERLLTAKIKVIGDPWASIPEPSKREPNADLSQNLYVKRAPRPQQRRANPIYSSPPPPPQPTYTPPPPKSTPLSSKINGYSGNCYCCGLFVPATVGYIFKPSAKWEVVCDPCNRSSAPIPVRAAKPKGATVSDILSGLGTTP